MVRDTIDALNKLGDRALSVVLVWIPAHRGYFGNDRADDLAKEGTIRQSVNFCSLQPRSHLKNQIKDHIYANWRLQWTETGLASHSKHFYCGPSPLKARFVYKLARLELGRLVRIVSGHNNLNSFQTRIGLWGSAVCRFCEQEPEDMLHLLYTCPRFNTLRREIFLDQLPDNNMKWSVRSLLEFSFAPGINEALEGTWAHGDAANFATLDSDLDSLSPLDSYESSDSDM